MSGINDEERQWVVNPLHILEPENGEVVNEQQRNCEVVRGWQQRKSIRVLGQLEEIDEELHYRLNYAVKCSTLFVLSAVTCYVLNVSIYNSNNMFLAISFMMSITLLLLAISAMYYRNVSFFVFTLLRKQVNVLVIIALCTSDLLITCTTYENYFEICTSIVYFIGVLLFISLDILNTKNRLFILFVGWMSIIFNVVGIYNRVWTGVDQGVILVQYGNDYVVYKRSVKRSIYFQILTFSLNGLYILFKDKDMKLMMFGVGNVYRNSGESAIRVRAHQQQNDNDGSRRRNTMIEMGIVIELDNNVPNRVKWGQRLCAVSLVFCLLFFINVFGIKDRILRNIGFGVSFYIGVCGNSLIIYFKNFSPRIFWKMTSQANVFVVLMLAIGIVIVDMLTSTEFFTTFIYSGGYLASVYLFLFQDCVIRKSRALVLTIGICFVAMHLWNIYSNFFTSNSIGVIIFKYGDDYVFYKRSIKRSIFCQVLFFSLNGLSVMFTDKKMEKLMFGTGNLYRDSGITTEYTTGDVLPLNI